MAKDVYPKTGQRIFYTREESTGKPYDPESDLTAWTAIPDDYPHWRRLDVIPEAIDVEIPFIEKLKRFDIGDGKHASVVQSGNIEPVDFTLDMDAQGCEFLPCAVGAPSLVSSGGQAMTQVINTVAKTNISDGDYFLLDVITSADYGNVKHYLIWFDVTGGGSAPTVTGIADANRKEVAIDGCTTAEDVADAIETVLEALDEITTANNVAEVITIVHAYKGAVQPAHDGEASTGFEFVGPTTWGSSVYSVTESLDQILPTFCFRVEQRQTDAAQYAEDLIYTLFGCVVKEITIDITWGNKIGKISVTFCCPYGIKDSQGRADIEPPAKSIAAFRAMGDLKESASNYIIMEGTTDKTPKAVESVVIRIVNEITYKSDLQYNYKIVPVAGTRTIEMEITGWTDENDLFEYWQETFKQSGSDWIPNGASGRLNTVFKLQRDATYDYIMIAIYNWIVESHNFHFADVGEGIKVVEMKFTDGSSNASGYAITDFDFVSYIDQCVLTYNA